MLAHPYKPCRSNIYHRNGFGISSLHFHNALAVVNVSVLVLVFGEVKPQRLRDSRSSRDIVALGALTESEAADAFATPSASVASGDFAAPAILTDSGSRDLHGPTARESFQVPRLPWPPETSRPHASSQNPWASEASQNQALSRLPWLR